MAEKRKSGEASDPRGKGRVAGRVDPEDDVTLELSLPLAKARGGGESDEARIVDAQLASHVDPETDDTLEPGTLLNDRFEIVELVHSGGMGHVYKAIDRRRHPESSAQIHVAIKMLREFLSDRDDVRMMLQREAARAQSLSHPNIINIFDFDEHEGRFYLVMEWLEGESVNALLRRTSGQRLSPAFAWAVIEGAAAAISHVHLNNIVHADINPSNIFITANHDVKLLDFGVSRCANDLHDPSDDWVSWATQTYASPEVLSGLPPVFQDDVFSLGCVAYRLLAGEHPFAGSPSLIAKHDDVVVDPVPGVPESDWQIIGRALAYSRSERPETVEVFLRNQLPAAAGDAGAGKSGWGATLLRWGLPVATAVAAALAVGWWLRPDIPVTGAQPERAQEATENAIGEAPLREASVPAEMPLAATLLAAARQAVEEQRLVIPEDDNAREWYRETLAVDPENPEALRGLRSISDIFVERADTALKAGNPRTAASALTIASETDADNPAISIVTDLLIAQGDAYLTTARMAASAGDIEQANAALGRAEQYAHIDPATVNALREQLAGIAMEAALLERLGIVDEHIAAGRLFEPAGSNAREALAELNDEYGSDPRFYAANQRLAERLLTRAAFASTAGNVTDAERLIDAAASLGVLETEVELARESIVTTAASAATDADGPIVRDAATSLSSTAIDDEIPVGADAGLAEPARDPAMAATEDAGSQGPIVGEVPDGLASTTIDDETPLAADIELAESAQDPVMAASEADSPQSGSDAAAEPSEGPPGASRGSTPMRLEDLGLERFIAPTYPRSARRREITGYVEVAFDITPEGRTDAIEVLNGVPAEIFDESAAAAVRKWRFAPRQDTVRGNVTLRFEIADQ